MHFIVEVVIPPTEESSIKDVIDQILNPLLVSDEGGNKSADWFDWYVIGGRFSGSKELANIDKTKMDEFNEELNRRNVTVSSVTCGKQELSPESQIPAVDALWREWFPGHGDKCLIFAHSGNRGDIVDGNYCRVADIPENAECERLIVTGWGYGDNENVLEVRDMIATEYWNRYRHQEADFDGNVKSGVARIQQEDAEKMESIAQRYAERPWKEYPEYLDHAKKQTITDDWLVVTVDCHD